MESVQQAVARSRAGIGRYHKESSAVAGAFKALHDAALADGELTRSVKELMAFAIALVIDCKGCAGWHLQAASEAGASRRMAIEAMDVAVVMGGGPAVIEMGEAMSMVDELLPE